jgi:hypothetical protein
VRAYASQGVGHWDESDDRASLQKAGIIDVSDRPPFGTLRADAYFGRQYAVLSERAKIKRLTMQQRKKEYLAERAA